MHVRSAIQTFASHTAKDSWKTLAEVERVLLSNVEQAIKSRQGYQLIHIWRVPNYLAFVKSRVITPRGSE